MSHESQVIARHADGTLCGHQEPGPECPGRKDYSLTCACGWGRTALSVRRLRREHGAHRAAVSGGAR